MQTKVAEKIARKALSKAGDWTRNQPDDMLKLFPMDKYGEIDEKDKKEYEALEEFSSYPCYLLNSITWNRVFNGAIAEEGVLAQIESFYENFYAKLGKVLKQKEYETTIPILLTVHVDELQHRKLYPVIVDCDRYKNCIILVLNE